LVPRSIEKDRVAAVAVRDILAEKSEHQVLVFVSTRARAEKQAREMASALSGKTGKDAPSDLNTCLEAGAVWYHAGLSQATLEDIRGRFTELGSHLKVGFTTTALMMGVNLPATHVLVLDTKRSPDDPAVSTQEILQMIGRAGRGNREGTGIIVLEEDREDLE